MDNTQVEAQEFFLLGYWNNPYRANSREYFWMRYFDSRKDALAAGRGKQKHGQPKTMIDWLEGANRVFGSKEAFLKAALKVGLNPLLD
jgi:hypothetical protein